MDSLRMLFLPYLEIASRLGIAAGLGALVGLEREARGHPAGFRTLIIISMSSALIMILSIKISGGADYTDPGRIAAQVISGMGFLGAGVIMRTGLTVRGLTTAAMMWGVTAIGLCVGAGYSLEAMMATSVILVVQYILPPIERVLLRSHSKQVLYLHANPRAGLVDDLTKALSKHGQSVEKLKVKHYSADEWRMKVTVRATSAAARIDPAALLLDVDGVQIVSRENIPIDDDEEYADKSQKQSKSD